MTRILLCTVRWCNIFTIRKRTMYTTSIKCFTVKQANIKQKLTKCSIKCHIHYFGHLIQKWHIPLLKITWCSSINALPQNKELETHGLLYDTIILYHIKHYVDVTHTLTKLLWKDEVWIWMDNHECTFWELKSCLQQPLMLSYLDPDKPSFLFIDASNLVGVLCYASIHPNKTVDYLEAHFIHFGKMFWHSSALQHLQGRSVQLICLSRDWASTCKMQNAMQNGWWQTTRKFSQGKVEQNRKVNN